MRTDSFGFCPVEYVKCSNFLECTTDYFGAKKGDIIDTRKLSTESLVIKMSWDEVINNPFAKCFFGMVPEPEQ